MKKLLALVPLALLLTACGTATVEELIEDPDKLAKVNEKCSTLMMQGKNTDTEECNNAREAINQMTSNMLKGFLGK
ncbi:EexN family lipoprotein [Echinimonas agarilytica]|uniref:EexN family lipoprotein n=1 Tax=Echinimonas agarilytica TaxID=1215918 RepID=A0AA42B643_9GAMM|nr:EexN family lipoprotein [Echinimonas agarilytica]MCM2678295.1 EexN family lipoprotein [Echinimonas agarilytica]